ncbi:GntR family transcriptional regulator [Colwellia sp. E2M01]|uniref:GntR family transcriptional regulator n=1 Tax=Colwellia sp. E2M01 TaxID=2841561 RepID=UPI001C08FE2F|nr:GntR family transcriptional regulator [Colwellia sp. E2M01]MBU2870655.1 GntR family transcriptional regulator [Colwellia sp. E2M01]
MNDKQAEIHRIVELISKAIAQHRLKPGQRLVESQIVESLKANRNHVQAAFQRLALKQIINIKRNKGAEIAKPDANEARDIFATRRVIEKGILELITPDKIKKYHKKIMDHMDHEQTVINNNDRQAIVLALSDFHRMLAYICENKVLLGIFDDIMVRSSLIVALYQRNDIPCCASNEHLEIISALREGNQKEAIDLMIIHLDKLESELVLDDDGSVILDFSDVFQGLN